MERPFSKQALSGLSFAHTHTLRCCTLSCLTMLQLLFIFWIVPCIKEILGTNYLFIYWYLVVVFVCLFALSEARNMSLSAFVLFLDFFFPRLTTKEGRKSAGEAEVKEMHQPRICQDFFSCRGMYSCLECVWCCLVACHILCTYSMGTVSQHCFVSILQLNNNRCRQYRLLNNIAIVYNFTPQVCKYKIWSLYVILWLSLR